MTNVSVKVKRKTSAIPGKRMPLFLQIIYNRVVKRVVLDLKLTEQEWIETTQTILIPPDAGNERIGALMLIKETLERNLAEMEEIVQHLKDTKECSVERIVHDFRNHKRYTLWLEYIQLVIEKKRGQRSGTTIRNYQNTHKTFRNFLQGEDIPIKDVNEDLIYRPDSNSPVSPHVSISLIMRKLPALPSNRSRWVTAAAVRPSSLYAFTARFPKLPQANSSPVPHVLSTEKKRIKVCRPVLSILIPRLKTITVSLY